MHVYYNRLILILAAVLPAPKIWTAPWTKTTLKGCFSDADTTAVAEHFCSPALLHSTYRQTYRTQLYRLMVTNSRFIYLFILQNMTGSGKDIQFWLGTNMPWTKNSTISSTYFLFHRTFNLLSLLMICKFISCWIFFHSSSGSFHTGYSPHSKTCL